ncbi:26S proteasome complex subunit SEM1 [Sparganum proliferum]
MDGQNENLVIYKDENEFEEFNREEWTPNEEDASDLKVWDDTWDQADIEDKFTDDLRHEMQRLGHLS